MQKEYTSLMNAIILVCLTEIIAVYLLFHCQTVVSVTIGNIL